jgi:hypothetical protein
MGKSNTKKAAERKAPMLDRIKQWVTLHPNWTLTLVTLAAVMPFLAKPFNFDDPLFIWAAQQIHAHPGNPYGFDVNWYGELSPMWQVTKNPPLACYYLALAAAVLGWSEVALHFAFLLPALAVILGTHRLAQKFCRQPMLAALMTLFTPVFLISSTMVMCDVMMLAFWVWAVVFWIEGVEKIILGIICRWFLDRACGLDKIFWRLPHSPPTGLWRHPPTPVGLVGFRNVDSPGVFGGISGGNKNSLRIRLVVGCGILRDRHQGNLWVFQGGQRFDHPDIHGRMPGNGVFFCAIVVAETNVADADCQWSFDFRLNSRAGKHSEEI